MTYYKHQFVSVDRTLELYFSGCNRHCIGCQNAFLWDKEAGRNVTVDDICDELIYYTKIAKSVHILGGEPLEQNLKELYELIERLKKMGFKNIILFTGYDLDYVKEIKKLIDLNPDYVKYGSYNEDDKNVSEVKTSCLDMVLATNNQNIIKYSDI